LQAQPQHRGSPTAYRAATEAANLHRRGLNASYWPEHTHCHLHKQHTITSLLGKSSNVSWQLEHLSTSLSGQLITCAAAASVLQRLCGTAPCCAGALPAISHGAWAALHYVKQTPRQFALFKPSATLPQSPEHDPRTIRSPAVTLNALRRPPLPTQSHAQLIVRDPNGHVASEDTLTALAPAPVAPCGPVAPE
jgi:hypothetical protein